jgi:hypothetical protein
MQIPLITSLIHYFKVVYSYTGRKLYILLLLFLLGGLTECIGVSLLLPVLNIEKAVSDQGQYTKTIYNLLEAIGINVTLLSLVILLLIAFLFKGAFAFLQKTLSSYIRCNLAKDIRIDFCNKYKSGPPPPQTTSITSNIPVYSDVFIQSLKAV